MVDVFLTIREEDGYDEVVGVYHEQGNALSHARTSMVEELSEALEGVRSAFNISGFELQETSIGSTTYVYIFSPIGAVMATAYLDLPVFRVDHHEVAD